MFLSILQLLEIKNFVLLDKARKINNVAYNLLKIIFWFTAISNSYKHSVFSAFEPKMTLIHVDDDIFDDEVFWSDNRT